MKRIGLLLLAVVMVAGVTACTDDPPSIETTVLPPGTVGTWYNFAIEARERGLYWYVEKGSLPPDLKLGVNDGCVFRTMMTSRFGPKLPAISEHGYQ